MRLFGIDYGDKKIGTAFGDSTAGVAVPLDVIRNEGAATAQRLAKQIKVDSIELVVLGAPLSAHSTDQLEKTRAFAAALTAALEAVGHAVPVVEEDESYTTSESRRLIAEEGAGAEEDALAAMLVVQQYINRQTGA